MHVMEQFFSTLLRTVLKLVLLAAGAVVALVLLCVGLVTLVVVLLKALLTGRKPAWVTTFVRFRQAQQQFTQRPWAARPTPDDVVDVQANEVRNDAALPYGRGDEKR
jgi:hypothetical protein